MSTTKKNNKDHRESSVILIILAVALISLIAMVLVLCTAGKKREQPAFVPPDFDANAVAGTPEPPEDSGYCVLYQEGMSFEVGLCGRVTVMDSDAYVYLTNISDNSLWLKVRIYDEKGKVVGESGLIRPGEYIKSVRLLREIDGNTKIQMKIMSYEPGTYASGGAIVMKPAIVIK
jgi:hypothetical protein